MEWGLKTLSTAERINALCERKNLVPVSVQCAITASVPRWISIGREHAIPSLTTMYGVTAEGISDWHWFEETLHESQEVDLEYFKQ